MASMLPWSCRGFAIIIAALFGNIGGLQVAQTSNDDIQKGRELMFSEYRTGYPPMIVGEVHVLATDSWRNGQFINGQMIIANPYGKAPKFAAAQANPDIVKRCRLRDMATILFFGIFAWAYSQTHEKITALIGLRLSHLCCIAYASLSVAIDISIKNAAQSYGGAFPFHPACAVIVVEMLKLIASGILLAVEVVRSRNAGTTLVMPRVQDIAWLGVPALIYAGNNMLVFQAIRATPMSTFGVIRETMLIWNVVIWSLTFHVRVSAIRWFAVFGIFVGCTINQVPIVLASRFTWGVCWAFLLAFTTALGAVANEYAMKQRASVDINLQNCILYAMCGTLTIIGLAVTDIKVLESYETFFDGFVPECWQVIILQVVTGLAVSRILKYVEAVTKTIVAALRGPGVIFVSAVVFGLQLKPSEVISTLLVCVSSYIYLRQGPLVQPTTKEASAFQAEIAGTTPKDYGSTEDRLQQALRTR